MEFLSFLIGTVLTPLILFLISKINPNLFASFIVNILEKVFSTKEIRNTISNAFGVRLALIGISLITAIEDEETIKKRVDVILEELSELLIQISRKEV